MDNYDYYKVNIEDDEEAGFEWLANYDKRLCYWLALLAESEWNREDKDNLIGGDIVERVWDY